MPAPPSIPKTDAPAAIPEYFKNSLRLNFISARIPFSYRVTLLSLYLEDRPFKEKNSPLRPNLLAQKSGATYKRVRKVLLTYRLKRLRDIRR
jgi:hypothetical protein